MVNPWFNIYTIDYMSLITLFFLYCIVMLLMFLSCPTWAHSYKNKKYCIVYSKYLNCSSHHCSLQLNCQSSSDSVNFLVTNIMFLYPQLIIGMAKI